MFFNLIYYICIIITSKYFGPNIDPFPTSKEVWVTEDIFFNGVVPWEILIIVFFLNLTTISQIFIKIAVLGYKHFMLENRNISINMGLVILAGCKRAHIIVQGA
jgi:hypothetical protein